MFCKLLKRKAQAKHQHKTPKKTTSTTFMWNKISFISKKKHVMKEIHYKEIGNHTKCSLFGRFAGFTQQNIKYLVVRHKRADIIRI